ncbi:iron-sulfur cluster biosynthesis family protein [Thalassorhabdus alkalitolerans]|uniref:Iron-sulfur cluster biosynthesis family protein n=1 Tax=Thalassorhabdus alkalitolerans TaxID=2282697 RepID=A0ABW0YN54_9BACI|nr:iron-sulfur cluster biosynthesis family protein [Thalassobacillus sp. C254]
MDFTISSEAAKHYKKEMELKEGDAVRLFVRVGGVGSGGFSIGVAKETPSPTSFQVTKEGVTFFVTEEDQWYVDGMTISYEPGIDYFHFENPKIKDVINPE